MTAPVSSDLAAVLDDLERAHAAATPGPWELDPAALFASNDSGDLLFDYRDVVLVEDVPEGVAQCTADGELIVAAVNAVPTLIAELRKRDAALRAVEALADKWEKGATRWEHPLPVPTEVHAIRAALTAALSPESVTS